MTTKHFLSGDLRDLGLDAIGDRRAVVWLVTNLPAGVALVDYDAGQVVLRGRKRIPLTGSTFLTELIATDSTGTNVPDESLRYGVYVDHYEDGEANKPTTWFSGWFTLTEDSTLAVKANSSVSALVDLDELALDAAINAKVATKVPGTELAYVQAVAGMTTTNTTAGGAGGNLTALQVTFTSNGRPVDIEFYIAAARHSVANTRISVLLVVDGVTFGTSNQAGNVTAPSTAAGNSLYIKRRVVFAAGASVTIVPNVYAAAAGTTTLTADTVQPAWMSVTSR